MECIRKKVEPRKTQPKQVGWSSCGFKLKLKNENLVQVDVSEVRLSCERVRGQYQS